MGAVLQRSTGVYIIDCHTAGQLPNLIFRFGGKDYALGPDAYILFDPSSQQCFTAITSTDLSRNLFIIGDVFLR